MVRASAWRERGLVAPEETVTRLSPRPEVGLVEGPPTVTVLSM